MFQTTQLAPGIRLHVKPTKQFKTVHIALYFKQPLTVQSASERAALAGILHFSNAAFPKNESFRKHLEEHYGTVLYVNEAKQGTKHVLSFHLDCVNDAYVAEAGVLERMLDALRATVLEPLLDGDAFSETVTAREKRQVIERLESERDDKGRYAQIRLLEEARPDSAASISRYGVPELLERATPSSLKRAYDRMIAQDAVDIYAVGDVEAERLARLLTERFPLPARPAADARFVEAGTVSRLGALEERQEMQQGKLLIAYDAPVRFGDGAFPAMQVFNGAFGGFPHSRLFMNVREKASLAYYANSSYYASYGLLVVSSGIDAGNRRQAETLIDEQLAALRGEAPITELELAQTKALLANQFISVRDSARGQIALYDQYAPYEPSFTIERWIERWNAVTAEDVRSLAQQVDKKFAYFLSGGEGATDEKD